MSFLLCLSTVGLQSTRLGMYIEDRVNKYLKRQNHPEAGEVFVRVVASSDKTVDVKPGMKARWEPRWLLEVRATMNKMRFWSRDANTVSKNKLCFLHRCHPLYHLGVIYQLQTQWARHVVDSQITCLPFLICRCACACPICPGLIFYCPCHTKLNALHKAFVPIRLTEEAACLTRCSTADAGSLFSLHRIKALQCSSNPRSKQALIQKPVIFWWTDLRLFAFLLTQGRLASIVPLCS